MLLLTSGENGPAVSRRSDCSPRDEQCHAIFPRLRNFARVECLSNRTRTSVRKLNSCGVGVSTDERYPLASNGYRGAFDGNLMLLASSMGLRVSTTAAPADPRYSRL